MSETSRKSPTQRRTCCKTFSAKTRARAAWCMVWRAFRSAPPWSWKSFSRWRGKMLTSFQSAAPTQEVAAERPTFYRTIQIDGISIFYREAGPKDAPTLLLLHGLPSSSRMFEPLFARLSDRYHLVAPDYPGFGHSDWPDPKKFAYTFDHIAEIMNHF